jgi:protein TonB
VKLLPLGTLQLALGASIVVHAALLTVRLVEPGAFKRIMQDSPLEVILVNTNPQERPDKARPLPSLPWRAVEMPSAAGPKARCHRP